MEFPYETDAKGHERPIVGVRFCCDGHPLSSIGLVKCLLDTGALHTMLRWEVGEMFGLDLAAADDHPNLGVGGEKRTGVKSVTLTLEIPNEAETEFVEVPEIPVLFVKGEFPTAGLLGSSALRSLVVVFREYEARVNIRPALDFLDHDCPHSNGCHLL